MTDHQHDEHSRSGRVAIVTGARETEEIDAVAATGGNQHVVAVSADVTREEDCARVVDTAREPRRRRCA